MHRFRHKFRSCFALIALTSSIAASGEPGTSPNAKQTPPHIAELIQRLEHSDFAQREAASRQLQESGTEAIAALLDAAIHQPPEAAIRSLHILENLLLSDDMSVFEAADDGLTQLMASDRGNVVVAASQILSRHMLLREERAVAAIRELGGTVQYDVPDPNQDVRRQIFLGPERHQLSSLDFVPRKILLGTDWKGGLEGLKYLRWLGHRDQLELYVTRGAKVSLADAQALGSVLPNLIVHERGPFLGLEGNTHPGVEQCIVGRVVADGPAARAGLQANDNILQLEGRKITSFQDLVDQLIPYQIGEELTLTIDRRGQSEPMTVEAVLGEWTFPDLSERAQEALRDSKNHGQLPDSKIPLFER
jgi:hypothetical protein